MEGRFEIIDHETNVNTLKSCYVYGRIAKVDRETVVVDWWANVNPARKRRLGAQVECIALQRGCVVGFVPLSDDG